MKTAIKFLLLLFSIIISIQNISAQSLKIHYNYDKEKFNEHIKKVYPHGIPKKIISQSISKRYDQFEEKWMHEESADTIIVEIHANQDITIDNKINGIVIETVDNAGSINWDLVKITNIPNKTTFATDTLPHYSYIRLNKEGFVEEINNIDVNRLLNFTSIISNFYTQEKYTYDKNLYLNNHYISEIFWGENGAPGYIYKNGNIINISCYADGIMRTEYYYSKDEIKKKKNLFCTEGYGYNIENQLKEFYADEFWKEYENSKPIENKGFICDEKETTLSILGLLGKPNQHLPIAEYQDFHGGDHSETRKIFKWTLNEKGLPVKCEVHEYEYSYEYGNGKGITLSSIKYQTTKYIYD